MPSPLRVGVLGTLVCDVILGPPPRLERSEGWGGIAYALTGMAAAVSDAWTIVPMIKVGGDVATEARSFLRSFSQVADDFPVLEVPEPNNRSDLRYYSPERRVEKMSGGVPAWTRDELDAALDVARPDALYVNFLSGSELDLTTMRRLRERFKGPIYVDLHMLLWRADGSGLRSLVPLADAPAWCSCFDFIQVNEDEMRMLADNPDDLAAMAMAQGATGTLVTLGPRGVSFQVRGGFRTLELKRASQTSGAADIRHGLLPTPVVRSGEQVDPTGCGDVWGATAFARLLAGDPLAVALTAAHAAAGVNAESHGVKGLVERIAAARPLTSAD